jgi:transcriptional regulator with XRE-family HTH domain
MKAAQFTKFSPFTVAVKGKIRELRLQAGYSMNKGARMILVTRKMLEDIETVRNYGCHIDLEILGKICVAYNTSPSFLFEGMPETSASVVFERPRRRVGSKPANSK